MQYLVAESVRIEREKSKTLGMSRKIDFGQTSWIHDIGMFCVKVNFAATWVDTAPITQHRLVKEVVSTSAQHQLDLCNQAETNDVEIIEEIDPVDYMSLVISEGYSYLMDENGQLVMPIEE